ncbi:MAG TPA: DUF58 domain-containing protein [Candidatus Elarobacter sp.]|jgi:uncharacterized protein (DUF58 family)|nr:DUF58 domain-containing protein [Candidatus Elarobacter sp.]
MMMRPTRRAVMVFAALLPLPWLLIVLRPAWWPFALDASLAVLIVLATDALLAYPARLLRADFALPQTGYVGEPIAAELTLDTGERRRAPAEFEVTFDVSGDAQPSVAQSRFTLAGDARSASVAIVPHRRGIVQADAVWLRWRGPLGFVEQTRTFALERRAKIVPSIHASRSAAFELATRDAILGFKVQLQRGEGSEFEALREYAPGMDTRFIDWKHSARHRKLLSKEFRAERNHPIVLAFDTGHLMREPIEGISRLDHSIASGLLLGWLALRSGDLVGSYSFGSRPGHLVAPARGISRFRHLQHVSADLAYGTDETNFTLGLTSLHARLDRRSLIVLFTDFVDTVTAELLLDNVQRLTRRHLVVFVALRDPQLADVFAVPPGDVRGVASAVLAYDLLRDRRVVFEKLQRLGVHCLDVPAARVSVALINRYLFIKQRGLL